MNVAALRTASLVLASAALLTAQKAESAQKPGAEQIASARKVAIWLGKHGVTRDGLTRDGLTRDGLTRDGGTSFVIDVDAKRPRRSAYLYSGTAGIVLFYVELHRATQRKADLDSAEQAAEGIFRAVGTRLEKEDMGLYTGVAGLMFTYTELYKSTEKPRDKERALACLEALQTVAQKRARDGKSGIDWNNTTDIIRGTAGIGLALLRVAEDLDREDALALAVRAGDRLLQQAEVVGERPSEKSPASATARRLLRWQMTPTYQREMPNFAHGTAGISYFLAQLYAATKDKRFLEAARAGADYLLSITGEDGFIYHNQKAKDLDYLGWCHGPPGTARLFHVLHKLAGEDRYAAWLQTATKKLAAIPIPAKKTPGFWNNHGQCCGTAGVADFFMTLRAVTGSESFDVHIEGLVDQLTKAAKEDDAGGMAWTGAEHRVRPDYLSTQTGYMQGAAGIGLLLLHDAARRLRAPRRIVLPDSPHPRR